MNKAEIHYLVPHSPEYPDDYEKILAAIGAYQHELPFPATHHHEATLDGVQNGGIIVKLVRTVRTAETQDQLKKLADSMTSGVESYFPPSDRDRLKSYRVDVDTPNG